MAAREAPLNETEPPGQSFEQLSAVQDRCLFNSTRPLKPIRDRKYLWSEILAKRGRKFSALRTEARV